MKKIISMIIAALCISCANPKDKNQGAEQSAFEYNVERFADLSILRYRVTDWDNLTLNHKKLIYCLSEAALQGRDIIFDQNNRYNLAIRRTLEAIYSNYQGDKTTEDYEAFVVYLKRVWFSNGIHHHYGQEKFLPGFSETFFREAVQSLDPSLIPVREGQPVGDFLAEIVPVLFDPALYAKKVTQDSGVDVILHSANNYYGKGVTQKAVENFYSAMKDPADPRPVQFGLNSRLVKQNGQLTEEVYKIGGLYSPAIERIVYWLNEALKYAENDQQKQVIDLLIEHYRTGSLKIYDDYSIAWVKDTLSVIDFVNGFTETYGDALGIKASWEALVNFKDLKATELSKVIGENAQWFEDHSPVAPQFKKKEVKGVSAKTITAAILGGDVYPATPIGINLPNSNWIRKEYGSKSVTITNITDAYEKAAAGSGFNDEFVFCEDIKKLIEKFGSQTSNLHTDLHECLGHASGQLLPGVDPDALRVYGAVIEEARADLFALYYIADAKMVELGLLNDPEAYKAEYYRYMNNGLMTQLSRIELGKSIEQAHMRNRALISCRLLEQGQKDNSIDLRKENGKTFVFINDYPKMRTLIGELLAEIQRIKSEGDLNSAQQLVEQYGIKIDPVLHEEILERYKRLNITPYRGFVNPVYETVKDAGGNIIDIKVSYAEAYDEQMLRYSRDYSPLPTYND
jgi:dipeptidyl-peptidase-3